MVTNLFTANWPVFKKDKVWTSASLNHVISNHNDQKSWSQSAKKRCSKLFLISEILGNDINKSNIILFLWLLISRSQGHSRVSVCLSVSSVYLHATFRESEFWWQFEWVCRMLFALKKIDAPVWLTHDCQHEWLHLVWWELMGGACRNSYIHTFVCNLAWSTLTRRVTNRGGTSTHIRTHTHTHIRMHTLTHRYSQP